MVVSDILKCHGHMSRLQRHVTHALSTPCFISGHVPWLLFVNCWWKWMCCECAYLTCILIYTGQKLLRLSCWLHTFCYGEYGSGSRLLISNTNTVCRYNPTRGSCGSGQGYLKPSTNRSHIIFTSFFSFSFVTCCEALETISQANFDSHSSGKAEGWPLFLFTQNKQ